MMRIRKPGFTLGFLTVLVLVDVVSVQGQQEYDQRFEAIAFDAFPIFDPRPIANLAEEEYPGRGTELMNAWRTRQFEYQWLRALSGQYADFMQATEEALVFAARQLELDLPGNTSRRRR